MKLRDVSVVLLALLLAAMVMVPMVSAEDPVSNAELMDRNSPSTADLLKNPEILEIIETAVSSDRKAIDGMDQAFLNTYESPAEKIIKRMQGRKYSENQITAVLTSQGYGWDPKTGACWKGTAPTEAELKIINLTRGKDYSPFDRETNLKSSTRGILSLRQEYRQMRTTSGTSYFGVNDYMKPGQTVVSSTGTSQHVVTTHVGRKPSSTTECWTEAGVAASVADPQRRFFTYDNDEGGWSFHGNAGAADVSNYQVYVTDTLESAGYVYHIWINGNWVRSGHLSFRENYVDQANEIWAEGSNSFSSDTSMTNFRDSYLYRNNGYSWWGTNVPTDFNAVGTRISESRVVSGNAYDWQMWIP
jgi:hypothetical protein